MTHHHKSRIWLHILLCLTTLSSLKVYGNNKCLDLFGISSHGYYKKISTSSQSYYNYHNLVELLFLEKYDEATRIVSAIENEIPKDWLIYLLISAFNSRKNPPILDQPNPKLEEILNLPVWKNLISRLDPLDINTIQSPLLRFLNLKIDQGLTLPLVHAAIRLHHQTVKAILESDLDILNKYDDQYSPRFLLNFIHFRYHPHFIFNNRERHDRFLGLIRKKLNREDLEIDTNYLGKGNAVLKVNETNEVIPVDSEEFDLFIGPIYVKEILESFYDKDFEGSSIK